MIIDQTLTQPAVAYALGRQVGGAVQRNLLRRRLRELLKARAHKALPGFLPDRRGLRGNQTVVCRIRQSGRLVA